MRVGSRGSGQAYVGLRRFDDAVASYEEAIRRMGRIITNVGELGMAHALAGNTQQALDLASEVEEVFLHTGKFAGYLTCIFVSK